MKSSWKVHVVWAIHIRKPVIQSLSWCIWRNGLKFDARIDRQLLEMFNCSYCCIGGSQQTWMQKFLYLCHSQIFNIGFSSVNKWLRIIFFSHLLRTCVKFWWCSSSYLFRKTENSIQTFKHHCILQSISKGRRKWKAKRIFCLK